VLGVAVLLGLSIARTTYGRRLTSVGINQSAARLVGINVRAVTASSFVLSSVLAGAAGVLLLARTGSGNPQVGSGYTLAALSAAFLGATAFRPGQFNVPGTLVGVLFVAVSVNGLTLAGAHDWVDPVFNGAALMAALALSTLLGRARVAGAHSGAKPRRHGRAAMAERPVDPGGDAPSTQQVVERSPVPPVEARAAGRKHSE
jgi:ribose transport system permease protein